ncbi:hypothetical protein Hanom_Chr14g01322981 [Helianthus anomalus]
MWVCGGGGGVGGVAGGGGRSGGFWMVKVGEAVVGGGNLGVFRWSDVEDR